MTTRAAHDVVRSPAAWGAVGILVASQCWHHDAALAALCRCAKHLGVSVDDVAAYVEWHGVLPS